MYSISKHYKLVALFVACFCFASLASASVIVLRPGSLAGDTYAVGGQPEPAIGGLSTDAVAVSWTQTAAFNNVFIQVFNLQNFDPAVDADDVMTVNFFLRSALDGADLFTGSITVTGAEPSDGVPFTGLTLDAGTYFLIASAPLFNGVWFGLPGGEENHAAASFGTEYVRNSENLAFTPDFTPTGVGYLVDGDLVNGGGGGAEIPEPGSWLLLGTGLLALGGFVRRRSLS